MPTQYEQDEDDATVRLVRPKPPVPHLPRLGYGLAVAALVAAGIGGWVALRPPPSGQFLGRAETQQVPAIEITVADATEILAARSPALRVFRFRAAPAVLVLSFPTLREQGLMLNRIGAFVEKAGLPRDRVLPDGELDAAIRRAGDSVETFYYGHDYRAADMARFFTAADRDGIALNRQESQLRALLEQENMLRPGAVGAVISIPPEAEIPPVDASSRLTILRHELSHAIYFTDPVYAAYARNFWKTALTEAQRAEFRRFLGTQDYDTANEDLMLNEAQAYLVHTSDTRFFRPELAGLSPADAAALRQSFLRGMPDGYFKRATAVRAP